MRFHVTRNRILSIVLAVCLMLPISPLTASAEELPTPESGPAPLAAADGEALGVVGTNTIIINLFQNAGTFANDVSHLHFSLTGTGAPGIQGISRTSDSSVKLTLTAAFPTGHTLTIHAQQEAFAAGTTTFGSKTVSPATQAAGTAIATAGAMAITVKLTSGYFSPSQNAGRWILGGGDASDNPITNVESISETEVKITLTKNISAGDQLTIIPRSSAYMNSSTVPFEEPLTVSISGGTGGTGETNVCEIGSVGYPTLDGALLAVPTGGAVATTITLLDSLNHDGLVIDNKKVTINPNGHTLTLGKDSETTAGLAVKNGGLFLLIDYASGQVNAVSKGKAVTAEGTNSHARVYNATSVNDFAAYAQTGGKITVKNDALGKSGICSGKSGDTDTSRIDVLGGVTATGNNHNGVAVEAMAGGAVTVHDDVAALGEGGIGVRASGVRNNNPSFPTEVILSGNVQAGRIGVDASDAALVVVNKDVTAGANSDAYAYGVWAQTRADVTVNGNVTAANDHGDSIGAYAKSAALSTTTKITIGGTLSGTTYVKLGNVSKTPAQKDDPSADASSVYNTYTHTDASFGTHSVWVKKGASSLTPLSTPAGLDWDIGMSGSITAKWNPVAEAGKYAVQLYKAGDSSGHKGAVDTTATNVDLTAFIHASGTGSYTFRLKALAPDGSPTYTDSGIAISPSYSYTTAGGLTGNPVWTKRAALPAGSPIDDMKYLNGAYWAVGTNSTLLKSTEGNTWTKVDVGTDFDRLGGITYGNGTYVLVGSSGDYSGRIYTSADGSTWTERAAVPQQLRDVAFGQGKFVAVGGADKVLISTDNGMTWQSRALTHPAGKKTSLMSIAYSEIGSKFVAVGMGSDSSQHEGGIMASSDGESWASTYSDASKTIWDVAYGPGGFVAVGKSFIALSMFGDNWTLNSSPSAELYSVNHDGIRFIAAGRTNSGAIAFSTVSSNGVSWTDVSYGGMPGFSAAASNGTVIAAIDSYGSIRSKPVSDTDWALRNVGSTRTLNDVAYNGSDLYVAVGEAGTIQTSPDGQSWTLRVSGTTQNLNKVDFLGSQFIAVGKSGTILTSSDGTTWTPRTSGTNLELKGIAFDGSSKYVVVGGDGNWGKVILTYPDQKRRGILLRRRHSLDGSRLLQRISQ